MPERSFCSKKVSRAKNPKYESMSLEELKANMEKSRQELEAAIHNKNILEQRKKLVERRERSHRLIVKGAEFVSYERTSGSKGKSFRYMIMMFLVK